MKVKPEKLEGILWDGFCPACALDKNQSKMRLNHLDFFECEHCKLQIALSYLGQLAVILNFRGKAQYRISPDYANEQKRNEYLCPRTFDNQPFTNSLFETYDEIKQYISAIK